MSPKNIPESLYRSVFLSDAEDKLEGLSTYPVFVTHSNFLFKEEIFGKLNGYLRNKYVNVDISEEVENAELIKEANSVYYKVDACGVYQKDLMCRYCIFAYYDGEDEAVFKWVKKAFDVLKHLLDVQHRNDKDRISLILCFSNDINQTKLLENISSIPTEGIKLYMLSYNPILATRKNIYIDSVCAAVISCCDPENDEDNQQRVVETENKVRRYVSANDALGKAKRCEWHALVCNSYDKENEFIRAYISNLISRQMKLNEISAAEMLSDVYGSGRLNCRPTLQSAFECIPRIVKNDAPSSKGSVSNLSQYFRYLFGTDGTKTVDLTLKATLSNCSKNRVATDIQGAVINIYKDFSEYAIKDLDTAVENMINAKIEMLNKDFKQRQESVNKVLNAVYDSAEVDQIVGAVGEYIRLYEELAEIENEISFWNNILAKTTSNHIVVEEYCAKSASDASFLEKLETLVNKDPFKFNFDFSKLSVPEMAPGKLVNLLKAVSEDNQSADGFIQKVKATYDVLDDVDVNAVAPSHVSDVFCLEPQPMIYNSFDNVQINCECASFMGKEYVGLYLIFNNMTGRGAGA